MRSATLRASGKELGISRTHVSHVKGTYSGVWSETLYIGHLQLCLKSNVTLAHTASYVQTIGVQRVCAVTCCPFNLWSVIWQAGSSQALVTSGVELRACGWPLWRAACGCRRPQPLAVSADHPPEPTTVRSNSERGSPAGTHDCPLEFRGADRLPEPTTVRSNSEVWIARRIHDCALEFRGADRESRLPGVSHGLKSHRAQASCSESLIESL